MQLLSNCPSCSGLVPSRLLMCPHCDAQVAPKQRRSRVSAALAFVSAGAASVTLMACYGMPPCDYKAADGGTVRGGLECKGTCVDPNSEAAKRCYDLPDAGQSDAGTTDAGTTDAGARDGG